MSFNTLWTVLSLSTVRTLLKLSRQCGNCLYSFKTVQMNSILSGRFIFCLDGFDNIRSVSILSGRSQYCPDGVNTVQTVSIQSGQFQKVSGCFQHGFFVSQYLQLHKRDDCALCMCRERGLCVFLCFKIQTQIFFIIHFVQFQLSTNELVYKDVQIVSDRKKLCQIWGKYHQRGEYCVFFPPNFSTSGACLAF